MLQVDYYFGSQGSYGTPSAGVKVAEYWIGVAKLETTGGSFRKNVGPWYKFPGTPLKMWAPATQGAPGGLA